MAALQQSLFNVRTEWVFWFSSKRCTSSRRALISDGPLLLPGRVCRNSGAPPPSRCSVLFEKPAAPPPAAGFFVLDHVSLPESIQDSPAAKAPNGCNRSDMPGKHSKPIYHLPFQPFVSMELSANGLAVRAPSNRLRQSHICRNRLQRAHFTMPVCGRDARQRRSPSC